MGVVYSLDLRAALAFSGSLSRFFLLMQQQTITQMMMSTASETPTATPITQPSGPGLGVVSPKNKTRIMDLYSIARFRSSFKKVS